MATATDPAINARSRTSKLAQARFRNDPLHAMQFRSALAPEVRDARPPQRPSLSDRECPLDTARARCFWHVGGTASQGLIVSYAHTEGGLTNFAACYQSIDWIQGQYGSLTSQQRQGPP